MPIASRAPWTKNVPAACSCQAAGTVPVVCNFQQQMRRRHELIQYDAGDRRHGGRHHYFSPVEGLREQRADDKAAVRSRPDCNCDSINV
jgi:hypothetical protein